MGQSFWGRAPKNHGDPAHDNRGGMQWSRVTLQVQ